MQTDLTCRTLRRSITLRRTTDAFTIFHDRPIETENAQQGKQNMTFNFLCLESRKLNHQVDIKSTRCGLYVKGQKFPGPENHREAGNCKPSGQNGKPR